MVTNTNWKTQTPATPDPTYIVVDSISLSADEGTVRDFFAFCGTIEVLELQKQESGSQRALLKFGNADSAKTSLLLSNALINHEAISVAPLFPDAIPGTPPAESEQSVPRGEGSSSSSLPDSYEGKPALYIVHELLAAGYMVGEHVVSRASEFDSKYRVTNRTQEQARSLDNQYKFSNYLQQWDDKFKVTEKAKGAYDKFQSHPMGHRVVMTVGDAYKSALQLSGNARELAERKRAQDGQLFGKIPLPPAPKPAAATSGATAVPVAAAETTSTEKPQEEKQ